MLKGDTMSTKMMVLVVLAVGMLLSVTVTTAQENVELLLAVWASSDAEEQGFRDIIERYQAENPNVTVNLELLPAATALEQIDVRLAAGQAPDIVRVGFRGDAIHYAQGGGVIDLTPYLDEANLEDFLPATIELMQYEGGIYGLPVNTDTFGLFYNKAYFEQAGITPPASTEECWTWEEFNEIARQAQENSDAEYGLTHLVTNGKRWLSLLYENGGQLFAEDMQTPMIEEPEGLETIAWTQSWYTEGLVPPGNSMRGQDLPENLFANGLAAMLIHGNYIMPYLVTNMEEGSWGVTYMPCSTGQGNDFGGTGLSVTKDAENPEVAADFVQFATNPDNLAAYAASTLFLPTRQSVIDAGVEWNTLSEEMEFFANDLLPEVNPAMASVMALPEFPQIQRVITDQLELAWTSGQSVEETAANIAAGVAEAVAAE
jgi:multiple sugar transport system substrate-binding protein